MKGAGEHNRRKNRGKNKRECVYGNIPNKRQNIKSQTSVW
jgi:hypothetical protein